LPGKPLRDIAGKPMLQHVHERGLESGASEVVVATDDDRIAVAAERFGAQVCMTGDRHRSGTERIAEVCDLLDWDDERIIVNLQGDEPMMPAALIDQCASLLADGGAEIGTLASPLASREDFEDPNVVKVIRDAFDNAIYFSRGPIPFPRDAASADAAIAAALHHHGIYAYRCGVLRRLVAAGPDPLEMCEQLEQLRALSLGIRIRVAIPACRPGVGVDTEADLALAARALASQSA
jgi:3-deoxy-manno-octulosonate cytidylyltransferase (CMP-KDO synthetase)